MTARDGRMAFVERASSELIAQGFPPMPARVIMALTASDDGRLTATELADLLEVSAAAISGAVRYLITVGFVRRASVPGTRRHIYTLPPGSAWYTASLARPGLYARIIAVLGEGSRDLPPGSPARARVDEMADFFRFFEARLPGLLAEWNERAEARQPEEPPAP